MTDGLNVMSGFAVQKALEDRVLPDFEARMGISVAVRWDPTTVIMKAIADGETADIVILTDEAISQLVDQGICDAGSVSPLAYAVLGLAVRRGMSSPNITTVEDFRLALHHARSIAYSKAGASGIYFEKLLERLVGGEAIRARATVIPKGLAAELLISGEADLAVQQISELLMVDGVEVVGAFPREVQSATGFSAAIVSTSRRAAGTKQLMEALTSKNAALAYEASGLVLR
ncbi:MAG TPA: substrate-binding domain-containing protein [Stellaceae bacterium]|nr:substrate-binding domain-containing protein [Stellaceae bacterium]